MYSVVRSNNDKATSVKHKISGKYINEETKWQPVSVANNGPQLLSCFKFKVTQQQTKKVLIMMTV